MTVQILVVGKFTKHKQIDVSDDKHVSLPHGLLWENKDGTMIRKISKHEICHEHVNKANASDNTPD